MISKKAFKNIKMEIKELQAKTHACYVMIQHLNRALCDMGMDSQKKYIFPEGIPMQNLLEIDETKRIAANFRKAILKIKDYCPLEGLKNFPTGSCGDAALLLGHHLNNLGYEHVLLISGYKGNRSHAWIQVKDLIIDITADQFEGIDEKVTVTQDDKWHREFNGDLRKQRADINAYDGHNRERLRSAYEQIILNL
jgi:hypothetical protein